MAKMVIYGLSIRTDRTDRQKRYTVCKECLEYAFLGFLRLCWFMVYRTRNITFGVCLSWFLRLCWFMVYRTKNITVGVRLSCRADRTDRTNRIALGPRVIMRCTLRMSSDRTDRTNRNALCPHVIMRCTLRMCSAYGP